MASHDSDSSNSSRYTTAPNSPETESTTAPNPPQPPENNQMASNDSDSSNSSCYTTAPNSPESSTAPNSPESTTAPNSPESSTAPNSPESTTAPSPPHPMNQHDRWRRNRLYHAALRGDYATAKKIIDRYPDVVNEDITQSGRGETILHVAVGAKQTHFVTKLLHDFKTEDFSQKDANGNTAFFSACAAGDFEIVQKFLNLENRDEFITTPGGGGVSPLYIAVSFGHSKVASKLFSGNRFNNLRPAEKNGIFFNCINNDFYDLALKMLEHGTFVYGAEIVRDTTHLTALHLLSRKPPSVFATPKTLRPCTLFSRFFLKSPGQEESTALKLVTKLWNLTLTKNNYNFSDIITVIKRPFHLLMEAIEVGNIDFVVVLINSYPELIWAYDVDTSIANKKIHKSMFYYAVKNRQVEIFKLMHEVGLSKQLVETYEDKNGNNLLHVAACGPRASSILGSALQFRERIVWFQEVREIVAPSLRNKRNSNGKTPKELFTEEHNELMKESERWMKRNAEICLVVATIVVTVIFQANFDISGDDKAGSKGGLIKNVILITNNIAMCTSSVAVMLNLFIITSRFTEDDLFRPLPCAFIGGIVLLYIAITCMLTSFSLTTFISTKSLAIRISTCLLELSPVFLFPILMYPIFIDLNISTFFYKSKFKPGKRTLGRYYDGEEYMESQSGDLGIELEEIVLV